MEKQPHVLIRILSSVSDIYIHIVTSERIHNRHFKSISTILAPTRRIYSIVLKIHVVFMTGNTTKRNNYRQQKISFHSSLHQYQFSLPVFEILEPHPYFQNY